MPNIVELAEQARIKAQTAFEQAKKNLDDTTLELEKKPEDKNLIKKVEGLKKSIEAKQTELEKAQSAYNQALENVNTPTDAAEKIAVKIRHNRQTAFYFRCGLKISKRSSDFTVTAEELAKLTADTNVEIVGI